METFESLKKKSHALRCKYVGYVPVIIEKKDEKMKFLVPIDMTISSFIVIIRKKIKLPPEKAFFMFTKEQIYPRYSDLLLNVDKEYQDKDGFLRFYIAEEQAFGYG